MNWDTVIETSFVFIGRRCKISGIEFSKHQLFPINSTVLLLSVMEDVNICVDGMEDVKVTDKKEKKTHKVKAPKTTGGGSGSGGGKKEVKKETGLGLSNKKDENFGDWYSEVVVSGEMIEY
ncbi:hypothetical protein MKW98_031651 [Papaver atlanticum]|uniref:Uncharacterized protein n=1 Tax=Papaver atlanticum TaxID=357466 RepID=A0AAD4S5M8_9MAGN|nr:hypothetical protein MKW98_031651 [Papaver atlanticum]